ncbi:flagellar biosynthetic protein FliO [Frigoribacterium sp. CFBP9039]|uniref:FliO/MopB family protein n=1 Tax=Frigoribacterium sp. CFBP9029 TaxID=3096541 RepID=UPI002A6A61EB|nr:flagellar biosynthetic protein FliO [Frigoribacterium sp. CFBP9039]MDY0945404.1 flagellar biosynthetic protein FliO [Frigoribacterium sp. CFBP9039]
MDTLFVGLRVVLSLGVVLALLYVLQKRIVKGGRAGRQAAQVTVVARQGIGAKASVVVVDVEGERLVLGVTDASVTVLAAADRPVEPVALELVPAPAAAPARAATPAQAPAPSFAAVLSAHRGDATGAVPAPEAPRRVTSIAPVPAAAAQSVAAVPSAHRGDATGAVPAPEAPRRVTSIAPTPAAAGDAGASAAPMLRPRGAARRAAAVRERAPRDLAERRTGRAAKALDGSILAPDTWRQAASALRSGRVG